YNEKANQALFFFSSRRRHTSFSRDWSSDVCSSDLRKTGMVFQDYALFPHLTIFENVAFGLKGLKKKEATQRVLETIELTGLKERSEERRVGKERRERR